MDDLRLLLAAIITNPDEDTPRLMFADRLEERGEPGDAERAEFIRVQIALAKLPPPHKKINFMDQGQVLFKSRGGSDYFEFTMGREDWCEPGDRVDFLRHRPDKLPVWVYGLRVVKIKGGGSVVDPFTAIVCKDEKSVPWTGTELQKRETDLFNSGKANWTVPYPATGNYTVEWDRGFYRQLTMPAADFLKYADALIWHAEQAVACPECGGRGFIEDPSYFGTRSETYKCYACENGQVKRPMPPLTAHPIRRVVLTTLPAADDEAMRHLSRKNKMDWFPTEIDMGSNTNARAFAKEMLKLEYPGVEFEMPS